MGILLVVLELAGTGLVLVLVWIGWRIVRVLFFEPLDPDAYMESLLAKTTARAARFPRNITSSARRKAKCPTYVIDLPTDQYRVVDQ